MKITPEIEANVRDMKSAGIHHRAIAHACGIGVATVSRIINENPPASGHAKPNFGELPSAKMDVLETLRGLAERCNAHKKDQDYRKIAIEADRPIAVMKTADWHLGGLDISYDSLLAHLEFLWNTPNF